MGYKVNISQTNPCTKVIIHWVNDHTQFFGFYTFKSMETTGEEPKTNKKKVYKLKILFWAKTVWSALVQPLSNFKSILKEKRCREIVSALFSSHMLGFVKFAW